LIEKLILSNLIHNEDYVRKVLPYIKAEYFPDFSERTTLNCIVEFFDKYNKPPTKEALNVMLSDFDKFSEDHYKGAVDMVQSFEPSDDSIEWLVDQTEKFCQDKAVYNAIMDSIQILEGKSKNDKGSIPDLLHQALGVSFDAHIGHDYIEDADARFDFYHRKEIKTKFDLDKLNDITKGGLSNKTLNVALAGTGVGKSLFMCHCAAANLRDNKNVLYITLEMSEERIAERIDANLMGITLDELQEIPKDSFEKKINRVKNNFKGRVKIKEYPTTGAGANHFRHLLNELKIKQNFVPDIIYVDYLNICMSSRIRYGAGVNSYTYVKAIAEELRGLAVEFDLPIVTATQTTRSGYTSSDVGLEDTSESFGLPATADFMFALISTEELEELGQLLIKQLKNRYSDPNTNRRFVVGVDRSRMTLHNVEQVAQDDIIDDAPAFDHTEVGIRQQFEGFKF